jgi:hypothetical protein
VFISSSPGQCLNLRNSCYILHRFQYVIRGFTYSNSSPFVEVMSVSLSVILDHGLNHWVDVFKFSVGVLIFSAVLIPIKAQFT